MYGLDVTAHAEEALDKLQGFEYDGVALDTESDPDMPMFGLRFKRGKKILNVWVQADPEGNGSGFLNIEQD